MSSATDSDVPQALLTARERAADKVLEAERLEAGAARARRRANAALAHYEQLLREHSGEQPLPLRFRR